MTTPIWTAEQAIEAAAQYHDLHAEGYAKTRSSIDAAAHRRHAAVIRSLSSRIPSEEEMVERIARKLCDCSADHFGLDRYADEPRIDEPDKPSWTIWEDNARATLAALRGDVE